MVEVHLDHIGTKQKPDREGGLSEAPCRRALLRRRNEALAHARASALAEGADGSLYLLVQYLPHLLPQNDG